MIRGLLVKTLRDSWITALVLAAALALVELLLMNVLPQTQQMIGGVLAAMPIVRPILTAILGMPVGDGMSALVLQSILWVHPVVLSLVWACAVVQTTRYPAGEIDRGTIDFLLGLPVSRRAVYVAETIVCLALGAFVIGAGSIGYFAGAADVAPESLPSAGGVQLALVNLFCVFVAVAGVGFFVSSMSERRGRAIAVLFGVLLGSFLLNVLAEFWAPAQRVAFLSVLHYYQPARVLTNVRLPASHIVTLVGVGLVAWIAGAEITARRSIKTV